MYASIPQQLKQKGVVLTRLLKKMRYSPVELRWLFPKQLYQRDSVQNFFFSCKYLLEQFLQWHFLQPVKNLFEPLSASYLDCLQKTTWVWHLILPSGLVWNPIQNAMFPRRRDHTYNNNLGCTCLIVITRLSCEGGNSINICRNTNAFLWY